jgi:hypothetical protein
MAQIAHNFSLQSGFLTEDTACDRVPLELGKQTLMVTLVGVQSQQGRGKRAALCCALETPGTSPRNS